MANGLILSRSIHWHPASPFILVQAGRWLQGLVERHTPPPCAARPFGLHLPERVWQRHSALLMCLQERADKDR